MSGTFSGKPVAQRSDELAGLIEILKEHNVRSYLEIGARYGDTFYEIVKSLPKHSTAVAVDMVDGYWGRSDSKEYLEKAVSALRDMEYEASCLFGDSTCLGVRQSIMGRCQRYDCIMIDGDHRFEGLTLDWINYKPLSNKLIVFHDIDGQQHFEARSGAPIEVPYVWNILKRHYPYKELIGKERGMGIGVLFVKP